MSFENVQLLYPHPHIAVYLEDNTEYIETFAGEGTDDPIKMIQVGMFAEGRDNVLQYHSSLAQYIAENGKPNFKKYGQAGYNVDRCLRTGYGAAYTMRVMPDDATYANVVVMITYGLDEIKDDSEEKGKISGTGSRPVAVAPIAGSITVPDGDDGHSEVDGTEGPDLKLPDEFPGEFDDPDPAPEKKYKLHISFSTQTITGATTKTALQAAVNALDDEEEDENGYVTRPFFYVSCVGRGVYGNNYRFRILDVTEYEDDPDYRKNQFQVLRMENALSIKEYATGSLYDSDIFSMTTKETLYLEELANDIEFGLGKVDLNIMENVVEDILEMYNKKVLSEDATPWRLRDMDLIYGLTMKGTVNPNISIDTTGAPFTSDTEGIFLYSGSDGSFGDSVDASVKNEIFEEMLIKAYSGQLDRSIKSKYSSPADFMLDANYPDLVKRQMAALAIERQYDCSAYLDAGILNSLDEAVAWATEMDGVNDNNVYKEVQHYKVRDTNYTCKTIEVTTTHFLAGLIPTHFKTVGRNIPMAMSRARIDFAVRNSFGPIIEPDDNDIKKILYNHRVNYYETVKYNVHQRGVVINTSKKTSDYLDEFNKYIVNYTVKVATDLMWSKMYNFAEEDDRILYKNEANQKLGSTVGKWVRSLEVDYKMSADDEIRSILRIVIRIRFKTVAKRGIVEVYLDPRNSESSLLVANGAS